MNSVRKRFDSDLNQDTEDQEAMQYENRSQFRRRQKPDALKEF